MEKQRGVLGVITAAVVRYVEMEYRQDSGNAVIQIQLVEIVKDKHQAVLENVTMDRAVSTDILIFS